VRSTVGFRNVLLLCVMAVLILAAAAWWLPELVSLWDQFSGLDIEVGS
jgi:hypothetical protein